MFIQLPCFVVSDYKSGMAWKIQLNPLFLSDFSYLCSMKFTLMPIIHYLFSMNGIYVIFWAIISFISSFSFVLGNEWGKILTGDLLKDIYSPIFIWIIAFLGDYLYNIFSLDEEKQILNTFWTKASYIIIEIIFVIFLLSIHWDGSWGRGICVGLLFFCMLGLKITSLEVLCPREKIESMA